MSLTQLTQIGGLGGNEFGTFTLPEGARISAVRLATGDYVDAIQFVYTLPDGTQGESPRFGGETGELVTIELAADEIITGFSGRADWYIDALGIVTNKRTTDLIGGAGGNAFEVTIPTGETFAGIYGRADWYLDALGVVSRVPTAAPAKPKAKKAKAAKPAKVTKAKADDLKKIEGIGPKIAGLLTEAGIDTFAKLAVAEQSTLRGILDAAGSRYRIADSTTWPEQAALAATGDMKALKALQAELKGGKRK